MTTKTTQKRHKKTDEKTIKNIDQKNFKSKGYLVTVSQLDEKLFPRTLETLELLKNKIMKREAELGYPVVALAMSLEEHVDKGIHLHFAIAYNTRRTLRSKYYNHVCDKQANIVAITWNSQRSRYNSFAYVLKTNQEVLRWGDIDEVMGTPPRTYEGTKLTDYVTKLIEEGISWTAIKSHALVEVRSYAMMHHIAVINGIREQETLKYQRAQEKLPGLRIIGDISLLSSAKQEILKWISKIPFYGHDWPRRECAILVVGRPKIGKSTLIEHLAKLVPTYRFPSGKWFTQYQNNFYHIMTWEEPLFKHFDLSFIKRLFEGQETELPIKGSLTTKRDRPLFIFTSNDTLKQLFLGCLTAPKQKHAHEYQSDNLNKLCSCKAHESDCLLKDDHTHFEAIYTRIHTVNLGTETIFDLVDYIVPK